MSTLKKENPHKHRGPNRQFLILVLLLTITGVSLLATISTVVAEIYLQ